MEQMGLQTVTLQFLLYLQTIVAIYMTGGQMMPWEMFQELGWHAVSDEPLFSPEDYKLLTQ